MITSADKSSFIHDSVEIAVGVLIADGVSVWNDSQIGERVVIGPNTVIGKGVFIDKTVQIGSNVKIQNYASIFQGVEIGNGVFIGPHVCFTNDKYPRAVNADGSLKTRGDWAVGKTWVRDGASVGAGSVVLCGLTIGEWAMIGAGSVVTRSVPAFALAYGNPAEIHGYICRCGKRYPALLPAVSCDRHCFAENPV